jgi:hypothetical protein
MMSLRSANLRRASLRERFITSGGTDLGYRSGSTHSASLSDRRTNRVTLKLRSLASFPGRIKMPLERHKE